jgi:hypothetical protein
MQTVICFCTLPLLLFIVRDAFIHWHCNCILSYPSEHYLLPLYTVICHNTLSYASVHCMVICHCTLSYASVHCPLLWYTDMCLHTLSLVTLPNVHRHIPLHTVICHCTLPLATAQWHMPPCAVMFHYTLSCGSVCCSLQLYTVICFLYCHTLLYTVLCLYMPP